MKKILFTLLALSTLSCARVEIEPPECWVCDVEYRDYRVAPSGGVYVVWEYWKQDTICTTPPISDVDFIRYSNCTPID